MWYSNSANGTEKLAAFDYISMAMIKLTGQKDPGNNKFLLKKAAEKNSELLVSAVANYSKLHQELFGKYDGELMHRPAPYLFYHNISGTFNEFLVRENLTILTPLLELLHTARGYGYLDEVGAIYGLMWNTPELVISAALRLLEADESPYSFYAFKQGFEKIWNTIVEKENLDIQYNINIVNIARSHYGTYVDYTIGDSVYLKIEWCDFLIWTPPMTEMLKVLSTAASPEEHQYFGHLKADIYSVSIMRSNSPSEEEANTYYRESFANKTNNHGVIEDLNIVNVFDGPRRLRKKRSWGNFINSKRFQRKNRRGKKLGRGSRRKGKQNPLRGQDDAENTIKIIYQIGRNYSNEAELNQIATKHYGEGFGFTDIKLFNTISWPYFYRWNAYEAMKGNHWDVFSLQGLYRTWYAGSSVCFESVKSVLEYNNLLLRHCMYDHDNNYAFP